MARLAHYYTRFEPNRFYHVYNRAVGRQFLFYNKGHHDFFIRKYKEYILPVADTYAYCLLHNHFHLLIKIREPISEPGLHPTAHELVSSRFRRFFQCYALAFNKQQQRIGTLFQTPFKRALVDSEDYFTRLVYYIHTNPLHHGLTDDCKKWYGSSFRHIIAAGRSFIQKKEVLQWFGGRQAFLKYHDEAIGDTAPPEWLLGDIV